MLVAQGNGKSAVLHARITITGGVSFSGAFDTRLGAATCADVAKSGTRPGVFQVPNPMTARDGLGSVGGGHNYGTDAAAYSYHGPGTYSGAGLNGTQLTADMKPNDQETHVFAFPTGIGTLIVQPDASGSFEFNGLQDAGSVKISGKVTWTCSKE